MGRDLDRCHDYSTRVESAAVSDDIPAPQCTMRQTVALIVVSLTACAREHFGREQRLTAAEMSSLTCAQIDLEIAKVDGLFDRRRDPMG